MSKIINITKSAEEYLAKLVADKDDESIGIRIFISDPGTPKAETCLASVSYTHLTLPTTPYV